MSHAFTEAEAQLRSLLVHLLYDRADAVERSRWEVDDITRLVFANTHRLKVLGLILRPAHPNQSVGEVVRRKRRCRGA